MNKKPVRRTTATFLLLFLLLAAACAPSTQQPQTPKSTLNLSKAPDHVVIVIEENKGYEDIFSTYANEAPFINNLAKQGASLISFYAFHHPSQPNYFELFAGTDDLAISGWPYAILDDTCYAGYLFICQVL